MADNFPKPEDDFRWLEANGFARTECADGYIVFTRELGGATLILKGGVRGILLGKLHTQQGEICLRRKTTMRGGIRDFVFEMFCDMVSMRDSLNAAIGQLEKEIYGNETEE